MEKAGPGIFTQSVEPPLLWSVFLEVWRKVASTPGDLVDVVITIAGAGVLTRVLGSRLSQPDNSASLVDLTSAPDDDTFDSRMEERQASRSLVSPSLQQAAHSPASAELQSGNPMHDLIGMFAHRENSPDSFDSICLRCYRTVGTRKRESDLSSDEQNHVCKGFWPRSSHISNNGTLKSWLSRLRGKK